MPLSAPRTLAPDVDFACAKAWLVRVPLNARLSAAEHAAILSGAGVSILVHGEDLADRARELNQLLPGLAIYGLGPVTAGEDLLSLARDAADTPPERRPEPDDPVLALYTSGTTGKLKAAVHTQASWAAIGLNILLNLVDVRHGEAMLHAASPIHASGTFVLPYWARGGRAAVLPGFNRKPISTPSKPGGPPRSTSCPPCWACCWNSPASKPPI
jgi:acyl-CoA synthetase (AMP-forming)/AMP-acid ligase II